MQPAKNLPDNKQNGISTTITMNDAQYIGDIDIRLDIDHTWIGDLQILLTHAETGRSLELLDRPGY
jgi:subtilisin-like proprotein convertase family protein